MKGLIADRRVSYYIVSAMRAVLSASSGAWRAAKAKAALPSVCLAAAAVAAELTVAGLSPKEAGERAAETAVTKGVGAARNLVCQHKVEQQQQQNAAAADAALHRAKKAAAAADGDSTDGQEGDDSCTTPPEISSPPPPAPESAAAASHGVHIPQQLIDTAMSEAVLPLATYFDKRLEAFLFLLIDEMRNLARNTWKLVDDKLLPAADSKVREERLILTLNLKNRSTRISF